MGISHPAMRGGRGGGGGGVGTAACRGRGGGGGGVGTAACGGRGGGVGTVFLFLSSFLSLKFESKPPNICKMQIIIIIITLIHNLLNQLDSTTINANTLQSNLFKTSLVTTHSTTIQS